MHSTAERLQAGHHTGSYFQLNPARCIHVLLAVPTLEQVIPARTLEQGDTTTDTIHTPHPFPLSLIIPLRSECTAARAAVTPVVGNVAGYLHAQTPAFQACMYISLGGVSDNLFHRGNSVFLYWCTCVLLLVRA